MRLTRRGFSLVELIVACAVGGLALAVMLATLVKQQRFHSSVATALDTRAQLRDAADVLAADLRGASVALHGLPAMSDTAVELFATIATSVTCTQPSSVSFGLPPLALARGNTLTSMLAMPDTGDVAMLYSLDSAQWVSARVSAFTTRTLSTACPASTGFTTAGDAASMGYLLTLAAPPERPIRRGAPIHFLRRARYSLYRSSDGTWNLGYRRCAISGSGCAGIQPVSGPYRSPSQAAGAGISFRYRDASGAEIGGSSSHAIARVEIVIRGDAAGTGGLSGDSRTRYRDSAIAFVAPRNRLR